MRRNHLLPFLLLSILPLIIGCSTGTDPGPCEEVECRRITHFAMIARGVEDVGDSLLPYFRVDASFHGEGGMVDQIRLAPNGQEVTSVRFNGIHLNEFIESPDYSSSGGVYFSRDDLDPDSILAPPGELNRWVIREDHSIDTLLLTIPTPAEPARITVDPPVPNDTLDPRINLRISWPPSTPDGTHRNTVYALLHGPAGFRILPIDENQWFSEFTDATGMTIPSDSLQAWKGDYTTLQIRLQHITVSDHRIHESEWGRALISEVDYRRFHLPVE